MPGHEDCASAHLEELSCQRNTIASAWQFDVDQRDHGPSHTRTLQGFVGSARDFHIAMLCILESSFHLLGNQQLIFDNENGTQPSTAHSLSFLPRDAVSFLDH